jgi:hypothetical protein
MEHPLACRCALAPPIIADIARLAIGQGGCGANATAGELFPIVVWTKRLRGIGAGIAALRTAANASHGNILIWRYFPANTRRGRIMAMIGGSRRFRLSPESVNAGQIQRLSDDLQ